MPMLAALCDAWSKGTILSGAHDVNGVCRSTGATYQCLGSHRQFSSLVRNVVTLLHSVHFHRLGAYETPPAFGVYGHSDTIG
jgi:hypothetical protein